MNSTLNACKKMKIILGQEIPIPQHIDIWKKPSIIIQNTQLSITNKVNLHPVILHSIDKVWTVQSAPASIWKEGSEYILHQQLSVFSS